MSPPVLKAKPGHGLEPGIVYGPVASRRFGVTLGINLLPRGRKHCSFNCVYCQLGWTDRRYFPREGEFPSPTAVAEALRTALDSPVWKTRPDVLVVSGNGEPALHPRFEDAVEALLGVRNSELRDARAVCFTCGSELGKSAVRRALNRFDECHVKFDADAKRADLLPGALDMRDLLARALSLENHVIQSCFIAGAVDNSGEAAVSTWAETLAEFRPRRVDIYTIDRATAAVGLLPVSQGRMRKIAALLESAGIADVRVIGDDAVNRPSALPG